MIPRGIGINQWTTKTEQQWPTNLLPDVEGHIFVLDHVQNLALHREHKEYNPVAEQYRPEHRYVEHGEECHHKSYNKSLCDCVPEPRANKYHHAYLKNIYVCYNKSLSI